MEGFAVGRIEKRPLLGSGGGYRQVYNKGKQIWYKCKLKIIERLLTKLNDKAIGASLGYK